MSIETFHLNDYFYRCNEWVNGKLAGFFHPKEIDFPHNLLFLVWTQIFRRWRDKGLEEKYGERILSSPNENPFSSLEFLN
jgi:hypothetical protein